MNFNISPPLKGQGPSKPFYCPNCKHKLFYTQPLFAIAVVVGPQGVGLRLDQADQIFYCANCKTKFTIKEIVQNTIPLIGQNPSEDSGEERD